MGLQVNETQRNEVEQFTEYLIFSKHNNSHCTDLISVYIFLKWLCVNSQTNNRSKGLSYWCTRVWSSWVHGLHLSLNSCHVSHLSCFVTSPCNTVVLIKSVHRWNSQKHCSTFSKPSLWYLQLQTSWKYTALWYQSLLRGVLLWNLKLCISRHHEHRMDLTVKFREIVCSLANDESITF